MGVRRCGKTYLMFGLMEELPDRRSSIYLNFEDRRLFPLSPDILDRLLEFIHEEELLVHRPKLHLFLDEVQNVPNWERWTRNVYDEYEGRIKILVTGSNTRLLSEDYGRLLTGRHLSVTLFPLSFREYLDFRGVEHTVPDRLTARKRAILVREFGRFAELGGFPEVALGPNREELLRQYYLDIVTRDITPRSGLRSERTVLETVAKYVITNVGSRLSLRRIASFLESTGLHISPPTVASYLRLITDSFMIFPVPRFSYRIGGQQQQPKYYCIDTGLRNAVSFRFSPDSGKLLENLAAIELQRRGFEVYYWQNEQQHEVDFVVRDSHSTRELFQVCMRLDDPEVKRRELRSLMTASRDLECRRLTILTENTDCVETVSYHGVRRKVHCIPLWLWLLGDTGN